VDLLDEDGAGDGAEENAAEGEAGEVEAGEAHRADPADGGEGEAAVEGEEQRRRDGALHQRPQPLTEQPHVRRDPLVRMVDSRRRRAAAAAAAASAAAAAASAETDPVVPAVREIAVEARARDTNEGTWGRRKVARHPTRHGRAGKGWRVVTFRAGLR
jgi:hypothetical protein